MSDESKILEDAVVAAMVELSAAVANAVKAEGESRKEYGNRVFDLETEIFDLETEIFDLETEIDGLQEDIHDYSVIEGDIELDWVGRVVREADGKVLDGMSPEAILAWLLSTLRAGRGLHHHHTLVA